MDGSLGIILSPNKDSVLLIERRDIPIWTLPGGGIEIDELPEHAVVREVKEETGYDVSIKRKIAEYDFPNKKNHLFECFISGGLATPSVESKNISFFPISALPELLSPYVTFFIEDTLLESTVVLRKDAPKLSWYVWINALKHPYALFKYLLTVVGIHWNS